MKKLLSVVALLALLSVGALAEQKYGENWNALGVLRNARYVYVTSYDGPQFSLNLWPQDREAIATVQNAIQEAGYVLVYNSRQADMVLVVQARPSSDLLAVYDGGRYGVGSYLWRAEAKHGLSGPNPLLMQQLESALERAGAKS
ncbi:MAG TPA: hypothetical protein VGR48_03820 [Terriglobales bacterium]|nr:hypothetical protein [Terriglobales bacterium]